MQNRKLRHYLTKRFTVLHVLCYFKWMPLCKILVRNSAPAIFFLEGLLDQGEPEIGFQGFMTNISVYHGSVPGRGDKNMVNFKVGIFGVLMNSCGQWPVKQSPGLYVIVNPILDTRISILCLFVRPDFVTLRVPPMKSETG